MKIPGTLSESQRDRRLAELLNQLAELARQGELDRVESTINGHPDLAQELRELWAVAQAAELARVKPPKPASSIGLADGLHPSVNDNWAETAGVNPALPREFGDFELLAEIGRGGMGVVYKARQKSLNRIVAIKMVREAHLASSADRARFRVEAESAARLSHANIVTVYEVGNHDGQAYICMELVEGRTLAEKVSQEGPLEAKVAAAIVSTIAEAVHQAHGHGIMHRDLKPSNILLAGDLAKPATESTVDLQEVATRGPTADQAHWSKQIKITDFGLAKQSGQGDALTRTGAVVGTPGYMAPEQATGRKDITPVADVYSLGAILYELLTGRPPFRASHPVDTLLMVLEQEPIPPRTLNPAVPRDLELVCLKCLQKPAELRYGSAAELADDLKAYLTGEPMSVETGSLGSFVSRMLRETHHAAVLENWGLLWMWHSLMIFLLCLLTQVMAWAGVTWHGAYLAVWGTGLVTWGTIFWRLRRRGGPVLFVERQIAHAWVASVVSSVSLFIIEVIEKLDSLTLSPVLGVIAGTVFMMKAGTLSGQFYLTAAAFYLTSVVMAALPEVGHLVFGTVSAAAFFFPGLKYYRQRKLNQGSTL